MQLQVVSFIQRWCRMGDPVRVDPSNIVLPFLRGIGFSGVIGV